MIETRLQSLDVPKSLRVACRVESRDAKGLADIALILTDYSEALTCANGKIVAIDEILTAAEAKISQLNE